MESDTEHIEILSNEMSGWIEQKEKAGILLPSKNFLRSYFIDDLFVSCNRCYNGEDEQMIEARKNLDLARDHKECFLNGEIYINEAQRLCDYCEKYDKPLPTLFEFVNKTKDAIED
jgi:hypothetical protein